MQVGQHQQVPEPLDSRQQQRQSSHGSSAARPAAVRCSNYLQLGMNMSVSIGSCIWWSAAVSYTHAVVAQTKMCSWSALQLQLVEHPVLLGCICAGGAAAAFMGIFTSCRAGLHNQGGVAPTHAVRCPDVCLHQPAGQVSGGCSQVAVHQVTENVQCLLSTACTQIFNIGS